MRSFLPIFLSTLLVLEAQQTTVAWGKKEKPQDKVKLDPIVIDSENVKMVKEKNAVVEEPHPALDPVVIDPENVKAVKEKDAMEEPHPAHDAAAQGDMDALKSVLENDAKEAHKKDKNGWQAIHEAARAGHVDIASMLVTKHGANVNERTLHQGKPGGTPLHYAEKRLGSDHPIVAALKKLGAVNLGPEL